VLYLSFALSAVFCFALWLAFFFQAAIHEWQEIRRRLGAKPSRIPNATADVLAGTCPHALVNSSNTTSFASAGNTAVSTSAMDPMVGLDGRRGVSQGQGSAGK
jgi:hypothetical protein